MKQSTMTTGRAMPFSQRALLFTLLCIVFLTKPFTSFSQATTLLDIATLDHRLIYDDHTLNTGDTAVFEVHLGKAQAPLNGLLGIDLQVGISEKAQLPDPGMEQYDHSWLADDQEFTSSGETKTAPRTLVLSCHRTDQQSRDGAGEVVRFKLVAIEDNTNPAELVSPVLGGQVIVENLDMKRFPMSWDSDGTNEASKLYPQPTRTVLYWDGGPKIPREIQILEAQGRIERRIFPSTPGPIAIPTASLRHGYWVLKVIFVSGEVETKKFLVGNH